MEKPTFDALVRELHQLKVTDPIAVGDRIKLADEDVQQELARVLGYAIGKTRMGRSFRQIRPRNTVVAGTAGIIFDAYRGQVLLQERWGTDGMWEPCGGGIRFLESPQENVLREALEETGFETSIIRFIGTFAKPTEEELLVYPDGERRHCIVSIFALEALEKVQEPDDEVTDLRWFPIDKVELLPMLPVHRRILQIGLMPEAQWPVIA